MRWICDSCFLSIINVMLPGQLKHMRHLCFLSIINVMLPGQIKHMRHLCFLSIINVMLPCQLKHLIDRHLCILNQEEEINQTLICATPSVDEPLLAKVETPGGVKPPPSPLLSSHNSHPLLAALHHQVIII